MLKWWRKILFWNEIGNKAHLDNGTNILGLFLSLDCHSWHSVPRNSFLDHTHIGMKIFTHSGCPCSCHIRSKRGWVLSGGTYKWIIQWVVCGGGGGPCKTLIHLKPVWIISRLSKQWKAFGTLRGLIVKHNSHILNSYSQNAQLLAIPSEVISDFTFPLNFCAI
jgi:hypothetical protein